MSEEFNLSGFSFTSDSANQHEYPRIWFYNGVKAAGTNGYFYSTVNEFEHDLPGWNSCTTFSEDGISTSEVMLAVIRKRSQAYTETVVNGVRTRNWLKHYEKGAKLYTELLCLMNGYDKPITLNVKGMIGAAINRKGGITSMHELYVLQEAKKLWKQNGAYGNPPTWSFYIPITVQVTKQGKPVYTDTNYGSFVTLPYMPVTAPADREQLLKLFVGRDKLDYGLEIYNDTAAWQKKLRANEQQEEVQSEVNQVQQLDDDLIFE